jgi:hypothetical protein
MVVRFGPAPPSYSMLQLHLHRGYQNLAVCECILNFGYLCTSDTGAWSILFPAMDYTEDELPTIVCAVYCYEISNRTCKVTCIVLIASAYFWSCMIFLVMFFFYCHVFEILSLLILIIYMYYLPLVPFYLQKYFSVNSFLFFQLLFSLFWFFLPYSS